MSNKDEAKREVLASELGQLKEEYSQMKQAFNELKNQTSQIQTHGLVQEPASGLGKLKDTFYQEANIEVASEFEQLKD
ncbi:MAG: hypothetical protein P4L69_01640 [Desulfosporosinus sp.]|nr:hypothetical protein [Desulfosporosinus sp.]